MRRLDQIGFVRAKALLHFGPRNGKHVQSRAALRFVSLFHGGDDVRRHGHAEIGGDERGFEFFKRCRDKLRRQRDDAFDFVRQLAVRFGQAGLEFLEIGPWEI